jgi:WD40 repeat protein
VINVEKGTIEQSLKGKARSVWAVDCSIEDDIVVSGGDNGIVDIWKLSTGTLIKSLDIQDSIYDLNLLPGGNEILVAASDVSFTDI